MQESVRCQHENGYTSKTCRLHTLSSLFASTTKLFIVVKSCPLTACRSKAELLMSNASAICRKAKECNLNVGSMWLSQCVTLSQEPTLLLSLLKDFQHQSPEHWLNCHMHAGLPSRGLYDVQGPNSCQRSACQVTSMFSKRCGKLKGSVPSSRLRPVQAASGWTLCFGFTIESDEYSNGFTLRVLTRSS